MSTMRFRCLSLLFLLYAFLFASQARAMPISRHNYDVTSLVYMSTNIVIANISENQQHKFTATVTQTLYGSLHPNDQITGLERYREDYKPSREYYRPLEDGMKVVLFLDRGRDISPFGVFLIDSSGHVHKYLEGDLGYIMLPTEYESLPLPSIEETTNQIATAVKAVEPIRSLLEMAPTRNDVPALLHLLDRTSNDATDCSLRLADAIRDRAFESLLSLNDPDVVLRAYAVRGPSESLAYYQIQDTTHRVAGFFADAERVSYLSKVLLDRNEDLALRMAAAKILQFHGSAQIQTASRKIFNSVSENPRLRALCMHLFSFDDPEIVAAIKRAYHSTHSEELRFTIEEAFLAVSDSMYQSLNPSTGGVTSIVRPIAECACTRMTHKDVAFFSMEYREERSSGKQHMLFQSSYILTNAKTGQEVEFTLEQIHVLSDWKDTFNGWATFELRGLSNLPDGEYSIAPRRLLVGGVLPPGHSTRFKIRKTSKGTEVSMNDPKAMR